MTLAARSLVDLTDDLLATEQEIPRWVRAAWSDAFNGAPLPLPEPAAQMDDA